VDDTLSYIHQDSLGSSTVMSDANGQALSSITYYPFGETRSGSVSTDKKFTGQRQDGTGLYYYNARYYDPEIGRFISADTVVQSQKSSQYLNRYSYTKNNPLKYVDPTGLFTAEELAAAGLNRDDFTKAQWQMLLCALFGDKLTFEIKGVEWILYFVQGEDAKKIYLTTNGTNRIDAGMIPNIPGITNMELYTRKQVNWPIFRKTNEKDYDWSEVYYKARILFDEVDWEGMGRGILSGICMGIGVDGMCVFGMFSLVTLNPSAVKAFKSSFGLFSFGWNLVAPADKQIIGTKWWWFN
jgi:RHS repeat-associated protein